MTIRRRQKSRSIIPVSSMADIAFLLLIFFILSSILEMEKEVPINLPESRISVSESKKFFNIFVTPDGHYIYDNRIDTLQNLRGYAIYKSSGNSDVKAMINADRELPFEYINNVMEVLRDSGVYNIVLVSKKTKQ